MFSEKEISLGIPLLRGNGYFIAEFVQDGVLVDNLGNQPFLPWEIFKEAGSHDRYRNGGRAQGGDAMNYRLGEAGLSLDSIEGHIAHTIYGKSEGQSVFPQNYTGSLRLDTGQGCAGLSQVS